MKATGTGSILDPVGCSKRPLSKAAVSKGTKAYPLWYVEGLNDARTTLTGFFSSMGAIEGRVML